MAFETTICQECPTPIQWPGLRAAYLRCINIALDARDSMLAERDTIIDRLTLANADLRAKLADAEKARDEQARQFDDYLKSLGTITLGINAELWDAPSAHGNDRLRWAVLIAQKLEELKTDRDEQAEAVRVLAHEIYEWRLAHVCSPVSLIDAPIIRARKRTANNPIAAAAVKEASGG